MKADGSIRVNTKLDTKPTEAGLKKLEQECEKTAQKIEQAGEKIKTVFTGASKGQLNNAFKTANKELEKTEAALADVESKIAAIQAETDKMLPQAATDEQAANLLAIEEQETAPLLAQRDELAAKAAEYKRQMEAITAELNKQATAEAAQAALKTGAKDSVADAEWLGKIQTEQEYQAVLEQTRAKMAVIEQEAARIAQLTGVPVSQLLQQNSQYATLARRAQLLADNQAKFKGRVSESVQEVQKLGNRMTKTFEQGIKRIGRMAVGLLGARSAFMALRRAATNYMEANEDLKYQVEGLWNVLAVAIGPVVEQLVSWLTIAISYINAFVMALWGVNLVAKANELALKKQAKATSAAAKASRQLAGFDEMNKLNDTSGGGGGAETGAGQFEAVPVNTKFIDDIIGKLNVILPLVMGIAAGFAAWKILSTFGAPLKVCAAACLIIAGAVTSIMAFLEMLDGGIEWGELGVFVAGIAALATGLGIAFGAIAASVGVVVGGIMAIVAGFKDWLENGKSLEALGALEIGILAVATAIGVILFVAIEAVAWWAILIAAAVGLVIGAVVAIVMYWDEVKAAAGAVWAWIEKNIFAKLAEFFAPLVESAKAAWEWVNQNLIQPILGCIIDIWLAVAEMNALILKKAWEIAKGIGEAVWSILKKVIEIFAKIIEIFVALGKAAYTYIITPIIDFIVSLAKKVYDAAIKPIIDFFADVATWVYNKIIKPVLDKIIWLKDKAIELFKTVGTAVVNFISDTIKSVINGVLSLIEQRINMFIRLLNGAIGIINKIPGVSITKVTELSIPRLAKGGIVNNPGKGVLATVGEAGAEAVLPLENNTEWMDILADKIRAGAQSIVIPIYLNGHKIAEEVIDLTKQRNFATNGAI